MLHKQRRYTSEIRDGQWQRLQWLLPKHKGAGRPIEIDLRGVMNAIFYVLVTGCQWRNLPSEYPNPHSVYYHYRKWCLDGTWQRINRAMGYLERRRVGRFARPSAAILDSQTVKVSDTGGISGYDGNKRSKDANDISWSIRLVIYWRWWCQRPTSLIGTGLKSC